MNSRKEELKKLIFDLSVDIDFMLLRMQNGSAQYDRDIIWGLIEKRTEYKIELAKIGG